MAPLVCLASFVVIFVVCVAVALSSARGNPTPVTQTLLNIHVALDTVARKEAISLNGKLLSLEGSNQLVNLATVEMPHITLYLTSFRSEVVGLVMDAVELALQNQPSNCLVQLDPTVYASGAYAMWRVSKTPCLQGMSDAIVNATSQYISPNQPIPDWVYSIADPTLRQEKIDFVRKYGSPNVFDQFDPHVTIGYNDNVGQLAQSVRTLQGSGLVHEVEFTVTMVQTSSVGPFGTVLRGGLRGAAAVPCGGQN